MHPLGDEDLTDLRRVLTGGGDAAELLELLTGRCVELPGVAAAALFLADGRAALQVVAASPAGGHDLVVLQDHPAEGPCHESHLTGRAVVVQDLAEHRHRWPVFVPAALRSGVRSVQAVPVRRGSHAVGVLGLFGVGTSDGALAAALADVAAAALVRGHDDEVPAHLQVLLDDRATIHQATGMLAETGDLDMARAHEVLRRAARERGRGLSGFAWSVATGVLPAAALLAPGP